jgi:hypothetical protein
VVGCAGWYFDHSWHIRIGYKEARTKDDDVRKHRP